MDFRDNHGQDVYVQTENIPRTSLHDLGNGYIVMCCKASGWTLIEKGTSIAGQTRADWLVVDVNGYKIIDTREKANVQEETPRSSDAGKLEGSIRPDTPQVHGNDGDSLEIANGTVLPRDGLSGRSRGVLQFTKEALARWLRRSQETP